ncbi:MAG: hypothetical protein KDK61_02960 [Simkania sp.]|nr:hypothetical protein [Simkania sp.]
MKKWLALLFLLGGTSLSFADYNWTGGQNSYTPQSRGQELYNQQQQQQQQQAQSPCASLQSTDPEAYAFSQQLSPIHQSVFCQQFTTAQRKQAMALAGSPTQDIQGKAGSITPDMAVEVVMQTARYSQQQQQPPQQQSYSNYQQPQQQQSYSYPKESQNSSNSRSNGGRYSNY